MVLMVQRYHCCTTADTMEALVLSGIMISTSVMAMGIIIGIIVVIHGNVKHHIQRYVVICLMCLLILV